MRRSLFLIVFFAGVAIVHAHTPFIITQSSLSDITTIQNPEVRKAYYGTMTGFPHTYQIISPHSFLLTVEVLVPDAASRKNNVSGIVVREVEGSGRVTEVARLRAAEASWKPFFEFVGGDSYRRGPRYEAEVEAGTYRIEVHTPDNVEKYVLITGSIEDHSELGYLERLSRIMEVKAFLGKSRFSVVVSPLVYAPLLVFLFAASALFFMRRKVRSAHP